jgi:hypothetical protein
MRLVLHKKYIMQRTILIIALAVFSFGAFAQDKKEVKTQVKVENNDGKIQLKIEKDVDGKSVTIDKTYNSVEEMKNDPDLEGINLHLFDAGNNKEMTFFSEDGEDGDHKVNVIVELDSDADGNFSKESNNSFVFKSDGKEGDELHEIKVWVDEDGVKHIAKNGEEIELGEDNTWTDKDGKVHEINKSGGNVMIFSGDEMKEIESADGATFDFKFSTDDGEEGEHKVVVFSSSDSDDSNQGTYTVKVIEHIKIHLKEVEEDEFSSFEGIDAKSLKMDELNYFPNPNEGKFTLQFKADKRPTEIKITSLEGKEIYAESLNSFEGTYQNEIDLSAQKRGIYLLQIIQGNKATNKKIVIE